MKSGFLYLVGLVLELDKIIQRYEIGCGYNGKFVIDDADH